MSSVARQTPASSTQRQFWILQNLSPDSTAYHVPSVFKVRGPLRLDALQRAFTSLVMRHEALRTTIDEREGILVQCVRDEPAFEFTVHESGALPDQDELEREIRRTFDLRQGPLIRVCVWRTDREESILAWTMHHVITDLASKDILSRELAESYSRANCSRSRRSVSTKTSSTWVGRRSWRRVL
jgi:NRPS condensation-like uncharacterized protein